MGLQGGDRTKHCWQNYVDYHKCILAKGEDFKPCRQVSYTLPEEGKETPVATNATQFYLAYRSLCPSSWVNRWDDQRGAGNFPVDLEH